MAGTTQEGIDFIPKFPGQVISIQLTLAFHVADDRFNGTSSFQLLFHLGRHASFSAGDENIGILDTMSPVAPVNIAAFHCRAGYFTNLKQGLGQGMSVIRVAMLGKHPDNKVVTVCCGHTHLDAKLVFPVSLAFGNTLNLWGMEGCTAYFLKFAPEPVTVRPCSTPL